MRRRVYELTDQGRAELVGEAERLRQAADVVDRALEAMHEDFVRTAEAKGVHPSDIVRRHAAPMSYPGTFSFIAVSAPLIITNMVLVERTLSVPGFFKYTWRASGHANPFRDPVPDFPLLCALGIWGAVLLIAVGLIADAAVSRFDPRVRTSHDSAW